MPPGKRIVRSAQIKGILADCRGYVGSDGEYC